MLGKVSLRMNLYVNKASVKKADIGKLHFIDKVLLWLYVYYASQ